MCFYQIFSCFLLKTVRGEATLIMRKTTVLRNVMRDSGIFQRITDKNICFYVYLNLSFVFQSYGIY